MGKVKRHDDYRWDLEYESSPEQKKRRAKRNKDRRDALKSGKVKKGGGMDVHHMDNDTLKGIRIISQHKNRSMK